ncbi:glycosyltransferase [Bacillus thuringiensis]|nr:glycosyltransferase [Bacillus thuringiensis]
MKNIAIIIPNLKGGGAERAVSTLSKNFSEDQYKIYLIVFDSSNMQYDYQGELIDLGIKANGNPLKKILNFIKRLVKIRKIKKVYNIETSVSFLPGPNLLNILSKRKEKVILSIRANVSRKSNTIYSKIDKWMIKNLYNNADFITVVSQGIKNDLVNNYRVSGDKIKVLYNSYELYKIEKLSNKSIEENLHSIFVNRVVVTVGRLENIKGHLHLIRAFKEVKRHDNTIKLVIFGEGELREYFEKIIGNLELKDTVFMPGFTNNPYKYIKNSSLFVLPSLSEGFPNALAEAMACGIPVIASDCKTGPREILAPDTDVSYQCDNIEYAKSGVLVPVCDGTHYTHSDPLTKEELMYADAIIKLLNDEELFRKYSIAAEQRVKDFNIQNIIKEWEEIL